MVMSLTHLATLRALDRLGTMVSVAQVLGYTPGAVSQQIAALETAVGERLVARAGRNVVLTDAGRVLAVHADRILTAEQDALEALRSVNDELSAPFALGVFGSTAAALLPAVMAAAQRRYPRLELTSRELSVDVVVDAVRRGSVDAAIGLDYPIAPMPRGGDTEIITLRRESFGLAMSRDFGETVDADAVHLQELADWTFIIPPAHTPFGAAVRAACRQSGFEPNVRHEIMDSAVTLALVARGLGAAFVTDTMIALNPAAPLTRVRIVDDFSREIVLVRPVASVARRTVRAVTAIVQDVVDDDLEGAIASP
ncbi:LysR family transcriptional regulator [Mycobacterium sp. 852013-50091_SCH5140682]|uniref:LysR family transcriptional regulator n=1 Tax=Mycobacterium sp. 852013-50091_SCH5140682 TaxID=1834109 RepID=UPI0007EBDA0F|nr:LysR family transcriptional regulator [Mycobacterium sp. 852013-50091_SCH5140682]OBC12031.1 LysR family transcriptional regulator [Mycobacterium sp. 852013-50091_SCH5140682]